MGILGRFWKKNHSKFKFYATLGVSFVVVALTLPYLLAMFSYSTYEFSSQTSLSPVVKSDSDSVATDSVDQNPVVSSSGVTPFITNEIKMLYPTKENGRTWSAQWSNKNTRTLKSGQSDPFDPEFVARGNGTVFINGAGIARLQGAAPRMYVYDPAKSKKWNNVEVTVYAKRGAEFGVLSYQGIVIGARSDHQDATLKNPCLGATYYGRLLYDGRAVFQKEVIHEGAYSINKPAEDNKAKWNTPNGTMPKNVWIGVKFVVKTNPNRKSVKLELYRDMTDGKDGGTWGKVAEYTDTGMWSQTNSGVNVTKKCGYPASKILLTPGTSIFIRNDEISDMEYKLFSIREID